MTSSIRCVCGAIVGVPRTKASTSSLKSKCYTRIVLNNPSSSLFIANNVNCNSFSLRLLCADAAKSQNSSDPRNPSTIRNTPIIAHVDHGKSTLCAKILRGCVVDVSIDHVEDYGDLERESSITI